MRPPSHTYYPPQPQPKKKPIWPWIIGAIGVLLFCSCIGLAYIGSHTSNTSTADSTTITQDTTSHRTVVIKIYTASPTKPTVIATSTHSHNVNLLTPTSGPTTLGQPLSHFIFRYGAPMDEQTQKDGIYNWNRGAFFVLAFKSENYLVSGIDDANSDGNGWDSEASAAPLCKTFLPADSVYKRDVTISHGVPSDERVYYSASLAPLFPASTFTDENGNITTPGTFAIVYQYDSATSMHITDCSIQIGLQGN